VSAPHVSVATCVAQAGTLACDVDLRLAVDIAPSLLFIGQVTLDDQIPLDETTAAPSATRWATLAFHHRSLILAHTLHLDLDLISTSLISPHLPCISHPFLFF
jgi:hypothetical protein